MEAGNERKGKRKQPNLDADTRRVKGRIPLPNWSARDLREAGEYLERHSRAQENGCRLWTHAVSTEGIGRASFRKAELPAHKMSFFQHNTHIPMQKTMVIKQTCGNKKCINPDHLELTKGRNMTQAANTLDLNDEGRAAIAAATKSAEGWSEWHTLEEWSSMDPEQLEWNRRKRI